MNSNLLVSVCIITYNHEPFIRQCIEGALNQTRDFNLEIVIGEDKSTDSTLSICNEYSEKYPDIIRIIRRETNIGVLGNYKDTIESCKGKYIAISDGDDYWTDPLKLKTQINFLEANSDFSICFHDVLVKYEDIIGTDYNFCNKNTKEISNIKDIIAKWYIPTTSMVFRNSNIELPTWYKTLYNGDYGLQLLLAHKGKVKFVNKVMGVYRKNSNSLSGKYNTLNNIKKLISLFKFFNKETKGKYLLSVSIRLMNLYFQLSYMTVKTKVLRIKKN